MQEIRDTRLWLPTMATLPGRTGVFDVDMIEGTQHLKYETPTLKSGRTLCYLSRFWSFQIPPLPQPCLKAEFDLLLVYL